MYNPSELDLQQSVRRYTRPYVRQEADTLLDCFFKEFPSATQKIHGWKKWPRGLAQHIRDNQGTRSRMSAGLRNAGFRHSWIRLEMLSRMQVVLVRKWDEEIRDPVAIEKKYDGYIDDLANANYEAAYNLYRRSANRRKRQKQ